MNWYIKVLKNYANFNGRARRKEFWNFILFHLIITYGLFGIGVATDGGIALVLYYLYGIATILPALAVTARRMHDVDKSGWFMLIPIYNLVLEVTEGTKGPNQYGPDPKGGEAPAAAPTANW